MKWIYLTLILLIAASMMHAQQVQIKVIDAESEQPLMGAAVQVGSDGDITNQDGIAKLSIEDEKEIKISYLGYETQIIDASQLEPSNPFIVRMSEQKSLLETATITATRYEKPLSESTVSIDVLKPEFLKSNGASNVQDAIHRMPGVQIIDDQANIRGGSGWSYGAGSRVMLLLDGLPYLQVDAATTNWSDLPLENIGSIEILKGASSALYGSSALNGVINFRTNYAKREPETEISLQSTIYDMPNDSTDYDLAQNSVMTLVHRRKLGKLDMVLGGLYRNEASFRQGGYFKFGRGSVQLRYRISDRFVVGLNTQVAPGVSREYFYWDVAESYRGLPTGYNVNDRLRYNIDPYIKFDSGPWSHKIQSRYYYVENNNDDNQGNQSKSYYNEYQGQYRRGASDLDITFGAVSHITESSAELYSDTTFQHNNTAAYIQLEKKFFDRLIASAGMRYEYNLLKSPEMIFGDTIPGGETSEGQPIFRLGLNYQAAKATFLRASWGQGYRFPSIAEKFINTFVGGLTIVPNPSLESETGWTAEVGLRQGMRIVNWNGYFDLSLFRSQYDNMIEFGAKAEPGFPPPFVSRNVGSIRIDGLELNSFWEYDAHPWSSSFQMGLTYIKPTMLDYDESGRGIPPQSTDLTIGQRNAANSTADDNVLKYRNNWNFKVDGQLDYNGFFIGANVNYTSEMKSIDRVLAFFIPGLTKDGEVNLSQSQSTIFDARIGWGSGPFRIQYNLKNITDVRYWSRPGFLEAPRNHTIRLDFEF